MGGRPGILWFVLDEASSERLRQAVRPLYPDEFYHHVTLRYGVEKSEVAAFAGKAWEVTAYAVAHDAKAQACRIETNGLPDEYGAPHITLSTTQGVKPFASVTMLHGDHDERKLENPIVLSGNIQFIYIDQVIE